MKIQLNLKGKNKENPDGDSGREEAGEEISSKEKTEKIYFTLTGTRH